MTDLHSEILKIVYKHLPGQHDQMSHGVRGGGQAIDVGDKMSREEVVNHIMTTNKPEQVASGNMTESEWAEKYLSNDAEYTAIEIDPRATNLPAGTVSKKVEGYSKMSGDNSPAIVIDSNEKLEARFGGGKLDQAYGKQPDTVIDGKHRVEAAIKRGDKSIMAIVPSRKVSSLIERSHKLEIDDFARNYFQGKGYPIKKFDGNNYQVERMGELRVFTQLDLSKIARNLGHNWRFIQ